MFYLLSLIIFAIDQTTKLWALAVIHPDESIPVLSFFNLILTYNKGVSFSMFYNDGDITRYALIIITTLISIIVAYFMHTEKSISVKTGLSLILGGAAGNIVDRILHIGVIDFLDFHLAGYHWPAFNIADTCICLGVGIILINGFLKKREK